jgi:hypothetical protein
MLYPQTIESLRGALFSNFSLLFQTTNGFQQKGTFVTYSDLCRLAQNWRQRNLYYC